MGRKKKDLVPYVDYIPVKKDTPLGKFLSGKSKPKQSTNNSKCKTKFKYTVDIILPKYQF